LPTRGPAGGLRNTQVLLGPRGELLGHYHKNHLYGPDFSWAQPGRGYRAVATGLGVIGLCVCFDVNFPGAWEALRAGGAEVVAFSTAWVDDAPPWPHWLAPVGRYGLPLVAGNTWGQEDGIRFSGGSGVLHPAGGLLAATGLEGDDVAVADLLLPAPRSQNPPSNSGAGSGSPGAQPRAASTDPRPLGRNR
ncbi:MAG: carbon-nitrogen hydrolase family protein, partial [Thermodesulfobacteriota bacterium]